MIIEGNAAGAVGFWSKHLGRTDTNDQVIVHEVRGTLAQDVPGALREMEAVASGSRCRGNFMYQANINPRADEHLTPAQWQTAVDTLEKNLKLEGHQRVVIEHVKEGRQHYHVIWSRVDVDTMRVTDIGGNFYTHQRTAQELEREFGLERTPRAYGDREGPRTSHRTDLWEYERGRDSGESPRAIKAELTELWRGADSGSAFVAAIEERGYLLAKGDRRDFCIIDRAGDEHSLARRLDGVTAGEVRERLAGIDREALPTVTEAKLIHEYRHSEQGRDEPEEIYEPRRSTREPESETLAIAAPEISAREVEDAAREVTNVGLRVFDAVTQVTAKLVDFVAGLFESLLAPPPPRSSFDRLGDDPAQHAAELRASRRSRAALENIAESIKRGDQISSADVRNLSSSELQNIKDKGDDYLIQEVARLEAARQREREGRERER